jgi:hypothetical protein
MSGEYETLEEAIQFIEQSITNDAEKLYENIIIPCNQMRDRYIERGFADEQIKTIKKLREMQLAFLEE